MSTIKRTQTSAPGSRMQMSRRYNMVWMEKHIREHTGCQPRVRVFAEIRECGKEALGEVYKWI